MSVDQLVLDVKALSHPSKNIRDPSIPFRGKWFTDSFPPDLLAIPSRMVGLGRALDAYNYLRKNVVPTAKASEPDSWEQMGVAARKAAELFHSTATLLLNEGKLNESIAMFERALIYDPESWDMRVSLTRLLIRLDRSSEALPRAVRCFA